MMKKHWALGIAAMMSFSGAAVASEHGHGVHWGYEGEGAPMHWGDLNAEYGLCKTGMSQSPVDIHGAMAADLAGIEFHYAAKADNIVNNGHTIQVNVAPGSYISVNGKRYNLLQFHFHSPSEHTIDGRPADMVAHLVHKADDGQLGVIGMMFNQGQSNAALAPLWAEMPQHAGDQHDLHGAAVDLDVLLPATRAYYNYSGSLTTPPCSEGVNWMVMQQPVEVSADQVAAFTKLFHKSTRPVQALNGRSISASH